LRRLPGELFSLLGDKLTETKNEIQPVWAAVGNIVLQHRFGPGGTETKFGTKQFRSGARVYIVGAYWGMCEVITVIGLPRKSKKYIKIDIRANLIENIRLKRVYKPQAVKALCNFFEGEPDKEFIKRICASVPLWE